MIVFATAEGQRCEKRCGFLGEQAVASGRLDAQLPNFPPKHALLGAVNATLGTETAFLSGWSH